MSRPIPDDLILTLPDDSDPCEFLLEHGAEAFAELLEHRTVGALEHAFRSATQCRAQATTPAEASRAAS